jgi:hypothetical protein
VSADARLAAAGAVLEAHGVRGASVQAEGTSGEIAAIRVPGDAWEMLVSDAGAALSAQVRALGFRYVAVDLLAADA